MLQITFFAAAITYIAMALTAFGLSRKGRLVAAFWTELLSVLPAVVALAASAANGAKGWVIGFWVFNAALAALNAWFISKRIQWRDEERAWADRYLS